MREYAIWSVLFPFSLFFLFTFCVVSVYVYVTIVSLCMGFALLSLFSYRFFCVFIVIETKQRNLPHFSGFFPFPNLQCCFLYLFSHSCE